MAWHGVDRVGFDYDSPEGTENGTLIAEIISEDESYSLEAICAILGNIDHESHLNPWSWEGNYLPSFQVPTVAEFQSWTYQQSLVHGYGLFGFTPANTYINSTNENRYSRYGYAPHFRDSQGSPRDGEAQVRYAMSDSWEQNWTHNHFNDYNPYFSAIGVDIRDFYYMAFDEFKAGTGYSVAELTGAFELCWEKPNYRAAASSYEARVNAAEYFYQYFQSHPLPGKGDSFNIMLYLKPYWKRFM